MRALFSGRKSFHKKSFINFVDFFSSYLDVILPRPSSQIPQFNGSFERALFANIVLAFVMLESFHIVHFNLSKAFIHINYYRNLQLPPSSFQHKNIRSVYFLNSEVYFFLLSTRFYCRFKRLSFCLLWIKLCSSWRNKTRTLFNINKELKANEYFIGEKFLFTELGNIRMQMNQWLRFAS